MKNQKKKHNKQLNIKDYKGYIAVLFGLFVILFVLIGIAIGMIRDVYLSDSASDTYISYTKEIESSMKVGPKESILKETKQETGLETQFDTETMESELETETIESDTKKEEKSIVDKNDPLLILINRNYPVPEDITYKLVKIADYHYIDERAYDDLQLMLKDAKKEGYDLIVCSSWRSRALQENLYANKIDEYLSYGYSVSQSEELAAFWVALPGTSEHEIGLAVDIVSEEYQHLDHDQADTAEQQWLMQHCHEYGFILRYPEDKQDITMIGYEPWHYRYVGKEAAKEIVEQGVCLEEYLGKTE